MTKVKFEDMDRHTIAVIGIGIGFIFGFVIGVLFTYIVKTF